MPRKDDYEPTNIPGIVKLKSSGKYLATADLGRVTIKDPVTGLKRQKQNKRSKTCDTLREAQNFLAEARREKRRNAKSASSSKITFEEAAADYFEFYQETHHGEQINRERSRVKRCKLYFQKTKIKDIDTAKIEEFFRWSGAEHIIPIKEKGETKKLRMRAVSPLSLMSYKTTLSLMWKYMRKHSNKYGNVPNVVKDAEVGRVRNHEKEILTKEELLEVFRFAVANHKDPADLAAIGLGGLAGMRRGEVLGLQWKHILWEQKKIDVCQQRYAYHDKYLIGPPKNGDPNGKTRAERRERYAALPDVLAALLKEGKAQQEEFIQQEILPDDYVFRKRKNFVNDDLPSTNILHYTWKSMQVQHNKQREKEGLPPFQIIRFHDLRHSFVSMCINDKVPQTQVSASVGHKEVGNVTMAVYWHDDGTRDDIIEFVDKNFPLYE